MKIIFPVSPTQWSEFQRLQKCLELSPDQIVEQALTLLSWVLKEKQEEGL
ncbi:MAG: hypothetical protein AB7T38_16290 [Nitrospirales bacterium]